MIELVGFGVVVSFGFCIWNFCDVVDGMLVNEVLVVVKDEYELMVFVEWCLVDFEFV